MKTGLRAALARRERGRRGDHLLACSQFPTLAENIEAEVAELTDQARVSS